jgi:hypothetical protein
MYINTVLEGAINPPVVIYLSKKCSRGREGSTCTSSVLKGQCHETDIFFRSKHFNQYHTSCFQGHSKVPYTIINFLFASLK